MVELVQLEKAHEEFAKRNTRVIVASSDGLEDSQAIQKEVPHLVVIADPDRKLISAAQVAHPNAGDKGQDVAAPTTFLIDKTGVVRWYFRPNEVVHRLSPKEVLAAVDANLPAK